jgi:hypothetical protein
MAGNVREEPESSSSRTGKFNSKVTNSSVVTLGPIPGFFLSGVRSLHVADISMVLPLKQCINKYSSYILIVLLSTFMEYKD